jgi:hypothetical protein
MDPLMKLVTTALKWSYAKGEADVTSKHLKAAAELLTLRRDTIQIIDAENNRFKEEQEKLGTGEEQEKPKPKGKKPKEPKKQPSIGIKLRVTRAASPSHPGEVGQYWERPLGDQDDIPKGVCATQIAQSFQDFPHKMRP